MALAAIRDITDRRRDRDELRRAVRRLQAATDVAIAVGGETDLDRVLEAIVERGRALVEARALIIMLKEGDELVVGATAAIAGGLDPKVSELKIPGIRGLGAACCSGRFTGPDLGSQGERTGAARAPSLPRRPARRGRGPRPDRRAGAASTTRTSGCSRPSPRARRRAWRPPGRWPRSDCRTRSTRRSRSAAAGPASCTTRPCRRWRCCACGSRPRCGEETDGGAARHQPGGRRADRRRDREAPAPDHRAAAGLARHDRPRGGAAGAGRAAPAGGTNLEVDCDLELPRERGRAPDADPRDGGLPAGPGGAQQRRQALAGAARGAHRALIAERDRDRGQGRRGRLRAVARPRGIRPGRHARARRAARRHPRRSLHQRVRDARAGRDPARPGADADGRS